MEETVAHASSQTGGAALRYRAQHQNTAPLTTTTYTTTPNGGHNGTMKIKLRSLRQVIGISLMVLIMIAFSLQHFSYVIPTMMLSSSLSKNTKLQAAYAKDDLANDYILNDTIKNALRIIKEQLASRASSPTLSNVTLYYTQIGALNVTFPPCSNCILLNASSASSRRPSLTPSVVPRVSPIGSPSSGPSGAPSSPSNLSAHDILAILFNTTNGSEWDNSKSWDSAEECDYFGVVCEGLGGAVE